MGIRATRRRVRRSSSAAQFQCPKPAPADFRLSADRSSSLSSHVVSGPHIRGLTPKRRHLLRPSPPRKQTSCSEAPWERPSKTIS
ncbi:hypothetical protein NDU88_002946 [Pleurodeles waltl]|uniref:Uncharacterized protein n=1 Tax=Pleurodeles waltl TaxID=8319 RepID=A0AAV7W5H1_PLEWA|nr:hypothetical protein NDU88_002946 [Pleurodeles waltl]